MKKLRFVPAIVFVAFIFTMAILFFALPKASYSPSEKRYLKEAPTFSAETLFSGKFGEDFEKYLSDHTAFRNFWVGLNAYYNLGIGNNGVSGIYHCADGYLVNDPTEDDRLLTNLQTIEDFAAASGLDTIVVIAPSTGYICSDILPKVHRQYKDDAYFEQFEKTFKTARFTDVREAFSDAYMAGEQIYYKTDHHWTSAGAYTAYCALSEQLGYTPKSKDSFKISSYEGFYGTTYSSSGFWLTAPDTIEVWDDPADDGKVSVTITEGTESESYDDLFFYNHLEEDDKYPVFLDGNHALTHIVNKAADSKEKLMVIKDSFAHSLTPFLSAHYSEIVMVDMRYYKQSVSELIESENIDQLLFVYSVDNLATDTDIVWLE